MAEERDTAQLSDIAQLIPCSQAIEKTYIKLFNVKVWGINLNLKGDMTNSDSTFGQVFVCVCVKKDHSSLLVEVKYKRHRDRSKHGQWEPCLLGELSFKMTNRHMKNI